jgi:hypothetical protein
MEAGGDEDAQVERPSGVEVVTAPLNVPSDIGVKQMDAYGAGEGMERVRCMFTQRMHYLEIM